MRNASFLAVLIAILTHCPASAAEPVTIPLKDVWALNMPGTRDVRQLEPQARDTPTRTGPLVNAIHDFLNPVNPSLSRTFRPGRGFAVEGSGREALRRVYLALLDRQKRTGVLPAGEVTLAFFARSVGLYVHLDEVQREGNNVILKYHFVSHVTLDFTTHFALIPMGKLAPGEYKVQLVQLPPTTEPKSSELIRIPKLAEPKWLAKIVCSPFTFEVK
jgi:hypothetical protein